MHGNGSPRFVLGSRRGTIASWLLQEGPVRITFHVSKLPSCLGSLAPWRFSSLGSFIFRASDFCLEPAARGGDIPRFILPHHRHPIGLSMLFQVAKNRFNVTHRRAAVFGDDLTALLSQRFGAIGNPQQLGQFVGELRFG